MNVKCFFAAALLFAMPAWPQGASHAAPAHSPMKKSSNDGLRVFIVRSAEPLLPQAPQQEDAGQRVFEQNCSRCHNAPEGFSLSITGAIVRHMRVRASLSEEEEKELLHFFNP